jgi:hypothetical protein
LGRNGGNAAPASSKNAARRPDDRHPDYGGCESQETQASSVGLGRLGHPLPHRFGKPREQQAFDREDQPDRGRKVAHHWLAGAAGAGDEGVVAGGGVGVVK